jgi:nicotinate-nucleotide adenylyltransferase
MNLNGKNDHKLETMDLKLGIFGGTFDPPHIGHQILAAEAHHQLALDKVLWVLTPDPPHKQGRVITPLETRLEMVEAAIADSGYFGISRVEIDRSSPHYAVDTVQLLQTEYPQAQLVYLMGGDSLRDLPTWHHPQQFLDACTNLGVMLRPGELIALDEIEIQIPGVSSKVRWVNAPLLEIASSEIRSRILQGLPFQFFLPRGVYQIIEKYDLYLD